MILNSASDVIYNGSSVQSLFYNGRQIWPITKTAVSLTLNHPITPTAEWTKLSAEAYDPYTNVQMYGGLASSFPSAKFDHVPLNSTVDIYCGRLSPGNSFFVIDNTDARYGQNITIRATHDTEVSAFLGNGMVWSASGLIYPITSVSSWEDAELFEGTHFKLPLRLDWVSGCAWSAMKTGTIEYTDTNGVVHSSSVQYPWLVCPSSTAHGEVSAGNFRVKVYNTAYIYGSARSTSQYSARVTPFSSISSFSGGTNLCASEWNWYRPTIYESSDLYWECGTSGPGISAVSPYFSGSEPNIIGTFGLWTASGVWT